MKTQTKEEAFQLLQLRRKAMVEECRSVARDLIAKNGSVTIDQVRDVVPLPEGIDGRVYGAVMASKEFRLIKYTTTNRKSSHKRPIGVFGFL